MAGFAVAPTAPGTENVSVESAAKNRYGTYDPNQYDYSWEWTTAPDSEGNVSANSRTISRRPIGTPYQPPSSGAGAGGGVARSGGAPAQQASPVQRDSTEISRLINEIRNTGSTPYQPASVPVVTGGPNAPGIGANSGATPYDQEAESGAYGKAKERTGLAAQSAMRGLREQLNARGLTGSGIESQGVEDIFKSGLGQLADTDRQLASERSGRAFTAGQSALNREFTAGQSDIDRTIGQNEYNANMYDKAMSGIPSQSMQRYSLLAQLAGMLY